MNKVMVALKGNPDFASFKQPYTALFTVFYKHDFKVYASERDHQVHDVKQRRIDVDATPRRRIDVDIMLFKVVCLLGNGKT